MAEQFFSPYSFFYNCLIFPVSYIKSSCQDTHTQAVILIGVLLILHINLERTDIFIRWKLLFMTFPFTYLFKSLLLFHPLQDGEDKEAWHAAVHRVTESRMWLSKLNNIISPNSISEISAYTSHTVTIRFPPRESILLMTLLMGICKFFKKFLNFSFC